MALFNFFRTPKPQRYKYVPRYYDPVKEELEERVKRATASSAGDASTEEIKARIQAGFRRRAPMEKQLRRKHKQRSNRLILAIFVALVLLTIYLISNYMGQIVNFMN